MTQFILGLGSNRGDRMAHLRGALRKIDRLPSTRTLKCAPFYESDAMLLKDAPPDWDLPFLNTALLIESALPARELLRQIKNIEAELGRRDLGKWGPREIDIDILCSDGPGYRDEHLQIPHAGLSQRPFALLPAEDLAPGWALPARGWTHPVPFGTRRSKLFFSRLVGVVNVTPDSFSDGGAAFKAPDSIKQIEELISAGVDAIDLGAESTRPGATPLSADDEWARLEPVLRALPRTRPPVSLDTRHAVTARRALGHGIDWLNDVGGFAEPDMQRVAAESGLDLVVMHSLGVPPRKELTLPPERDPVEELLNWGEGRLRQLEALGVARARMIFDPGIGFGKTREQSLQIFRGLPRLRELGVRILVGHSRKTSLAPERRPADRDVETAAASVFLAASGADYLRVHAAEFNRRALETAQAIDGVVRWRR